MTVEFTLSEQDYIAQQVKDAKRAKRASLAIGIALLIIIAVQYTLRVLEDPNELGVVVAAYLTVLVALSATYAVILKHYTAFIKVTIIPMLRLAKCIGSYSFTLGDDHIETRFGKTVRRFSYKNVKRIECFNESYYIYFKVYMVYMAYIIPHSAFADTQQQDAFLTLLWKKTGHNGKEESA